METGFFTFTTAPRCTSTHWAVTANPFEGGSDGLCMTGNDRTERLREKWNRLSESMKLAALRELGLAGRGRDAAWDHADETRGHLTWISALRLCWLSAGRDRSLGSYKSYLSPVHPTPLCDCVYMQRTPWHYCTNRVHRSPMVLWSFVALCVFWSPSSCFPRKSSMIQFSRLWWSLYSQGTTLLPLHNCIQHLAVSPREHNRGSFCPQASLNRGKNYPPVDPAVSEPLFVVCCFVE